MASAKSLEDMLSSDVDESAVSALVGSLESQLASPSLHEPNQDASLTNNHVNSGGGTAMDPFANRIHQQASGQDPTAGQKHTLHNSANSPANAEPTPPKSLASTPQQANAYAVTVPAGPALPASGYINQYQTVTVAPNSVGVLQRPATIPNGNANSGGAIAAALSAPKATLMNTAVVGPKAVAGKPANAIPVTTAPNVNLTGIGAMQNLANVAARQQPLVIPTSQHQQPQGQNQQQTIQGHPGQAVIAVAKSSQQSMTPVGHGVTASGQGAPVNMVTQVVSNQQLMQGLQIVNMNPVGGRAPNPGQKQLAPRVVLGNPVRIAAGQQVLGARTGVQGGHPGVQNTITLQPGMVRGTLLVKTENGQYQLVNVGHAMGPGTATGAVPGTAYRFAPGVQAPVRGLTSQQLTVTLPVSHANQHVKMQQGNPVVAVQSVTQPHTVAISVAQSPATVIANTAPTPTLVSSIASSGTGTTAVGGAIQSSTAPQMSPDTAKKKCKNFLSTLLRLANDQPEQVATNVKNLIQGLIDGVVPPEDFTNQLQRELNSSPQPCLIPFLKKSLPYLRHSLTTKELSIDGVRPPPIEVATLPPTPTVIPQIQLAPAARPTLVQQASQQNQRFAAPLMHQVTQANNVLMGASTVRPQMVQATSNLAFHHGMVGGIQRPVLAQAPRTAAGSKSAAARGAFPIASAATAASATNAAASLAKEKEKRIYSSTLKDDDDINDVAAMGGVNLVEESARIMAQNAEFVGAQIRSCKDENFLFTGPLQRRIRSIATKYGLDEPSTDVTAIISHAAQERLKDIVAKLGVIAEHRLDIIKSDPRHEVSQDVKGQLKFLEELDRLEKKRHEEQERELLLRAAKSRSKLEDPEQLKLKQKAKEMQRAELEEMRQREANMTALMAIGPRKKFKADSQAGGSNGPQPSTSGSSSGTSNLNTSSQRLQMSRPRVKRVNLRDLVYLMEQERDMSRSVSLYKAFLK